MRRSPGVARWEPLSGIAAPPGTRIRWMRYGACRAPGGAAGSHHRWVGGGSGRPWEFRVAAFAKGVIPGVESFATIGLSRHDLVSPRSERRLRLELVVGE